MNLEPREYSPADVLPSRPSGGDPTTHGVWLPMSFAMRLFHCYFGNGPRAGGPPGAPSMAPPPPSDDPPTMNPDPPASIRVAAYPSMYPQGVARK